MATPKFYKATALPGSPTPADDGIWYIKGPIATEYTPYIISGGTIYPQIATAPPGTVSSVNSINPDIGGNVTLISDDIAQGSTNLYMTSAERSKLTGIATGATANTGTVTSVGMTVPTGLQVSGSPISTSGTLAVTLQSGYSIPTTANQTNWTTAYNERNQWDGGASGLNAATGRTSLGGTTVGQSIFTLTNPSAISFIRVNANNTVTALNAADFRTAIGAGTGSGTVTSVGVSVPTGLQVSNSPVTSSGTIAISLASGYIIPTQVMLNNKADSSALANYILTSTKGANNGVAELDSTGKVPSSQLPSYVDDVLEFADYASLPVTGESGKIYITLDDNKTYRWSGSTYVQLNEGVVLGETASTAYRGDRGKIAYDHSQLTTGNPHNVTKTDVGLGNVENYAIASQIEAEAGSVNNKYMTPLRTAQAIDEMTSWAQESW